jgi:deoxycytidine triphosphate deaminase
VPSILSGEEISQLVKRFVEIDSGGQKQPAGYDVTVSKIYSFPSDPFTLDYGKKTANSALKEVQLVGDYLELEKYSAYVVELNEITTIPDDAIGILLPRSSLLRNGLDVRSALFDPGYSGQPKVMLVCYRPARIRRYARIGQLIIIRSDAKFQSKYAGQYQGERGT